METHKGFRAKLLFYYNNEALFPICFQMPVISFGVIGFSFEYLTVRKSYQ